MKEALVTIMTQGAINMNIVSERDQPEVAVTSSTGRFDALAAAGEGPTTSSKVRFLPLDGCGCPEIFYTTPDGRRWYRFCELFEHPIKSLWPNLQIMRCPRCRAPIERTQMGPCGSEGGYISLPVNFAPEDAGDIFWRFDFTCGSCRWKNWIMIPLSAANPRRPLGLESGKGQQVKRR
jgi:hypothetical protein